MKTDQYRLFASWVLVIPYDEVTPAQRDYAVKFTAQKGFEYWRDMLPDRDWLGQGTRQPARE